MIEFVEPKCPECGLTTVLMARPYKIGPLDGVIVFCGNPKCNKIITYHVCGIAPPENPMLIRPN